jgi:hypothetical protein
VQDPHPGVPPSRRRWGRHLPVQRRRGHRCDFWSSPAIVDVAAHVPSIRTSMTGYRFVLLRGPRWGKWAGPTLCRPGSAKIWPDDVFFSNPFSFLANLLNCC